MTTDARQSKDPIIILRKNAVMIIPELCFISMKNAAGHMPVRRGLNRR